MLIIADQMKREEWEVGLLDIGFIIIVEMIPMDIDITRPSHHLENHLEKS
jgi:hypothetical protein